MDLNRRKVLRWVAAPLLARLPAHASVTTVSSNNVPNAAFDRALNPGLGDVFFCRVSDERLLPIAKSLCPSSIASCEPRPGFYGITFCGTNATLTIPADRLS